MAAKVTYKVVTPLVIAKGSDERHQYLYKGVIVPENIPDDEIKRLLQGKFIEKITPEPAPEADPKS